MFQRSRPVPATDPPAPLDPERAHDTCFRCGRPTPLGVSLCAEDNPGRIKSPSSTQVHGTIVIGVIAGFVLLAVLLHFATAGVGPFESSVVGAATRADGGLDVVMSVANGGTRSAGASCRLSAAGAPDYRDLTFFTNLIPAGEARQFSRTLPPRSDGVPLQPGAVVARCN